LISWASDEWVAIVIERFKGRELDESELKVLGHVEHHGWNVTNIRDEDGKPGWAFTLGLFENYRHPEVIIFGMSAESRHAILNWIGENVRDGKPFAAGQEHDWVLEGHNCWSREVVEMWYHDLLGWAVWFYGGKEFPVVQCLWPSKSGVYPWAGDAAFFSPQPLLYEQDILPARMMHYVDDEHLAAFPWPFSEDPHQHVFISRCVVEDNAPIVRVVHDQEGDWQFLGPIDDPDEDGCKLSCFHCVVEKDPSIRALSRLSRGYHASRKSVGDDWVLDQDQPD
jgi:hypothetical protein